MARLITVVFILFSGVAARAQDLTYVTFSGGATLSSFSFKTDQGVVIKISDDGKVIEWGTEMESRYPNYMPGKLEAFTGRVDYYGSEADSVSKGKVKSIGTCQLIYYGAYDSDTRKGKLKSIGHVSLDYFTSYENEAFRGKLQFAGSVVLSYYSSFDNEAIKGKLKSIGNTSITYYSTFDDKSEIGKLKSLGMNNYVWYTSNDQYRGALKSGPIRPTINGITFFIM